MGTFPPMKGAFASVVVALVLLVTVIDAGAEGHPVRAEDTVVAPTTSELESTTTTVAPTTTVLRPRDVRILTRLHVKKRVVFITIDDGGFISDDLVAFLNRERIPITSFVMPEPLLWQLSQYRKVKRMTFENHSNTHGHMRRMTFAQQKEEICRANRLVGRMAHSKPVFFRPPGGDWNETTRRAAAACGIRYLVLWDVIADDEIIRMRSSHQLLPGDIILMHYRKTLIPSLRWVMAQLRHDGLTPALMRDYVRYPGP